MRPKIDAQCELALPSSSLKLTRQFYAKYEAISTVLDAAPEIVAAAHRDLAHALEAAARAGRRGPRFRYTSDTVLRILLVQAIEGLSLRQTVVRVDDSPALRQFTRLQGRPMMDYTTLCKLKNALRPATWERINRHLAAYAVRTERITGEALRLDTTAVETNIHWPTDSSLLWDTYRVLARHIEHAREIDAEAVGTGRLHRRRAKRDAQAIARKARKRGPASAVLRGLYRGLIERVEGIGEWARSVAEGLVRGIEAQRYGVWEHAQAEALVEELTGVAELGDRVVDQARRRVLQGESVPNDEKLFSLFETHTELLKRGKAGKDVEFGHMIQLEQVREKFITGYGVYRHKPAEPDLIAPALETHEMLFGQLPEQLTADKGYYGRPEALAALEKRIDLVSIAKKGRRTPAETEREHDPLFRYAQAFRAGIEGTISFLKRVLRLARCFNKSWEHFVATVGQTVFAHNLVILARA